MLEVSEINVFYEAAQALWSVSFKVNEGELVSFIGANGAGKTTTLNTISGILHPKSGSINFFDKRIDNLSPFDIVELGIVHVPEGRHLFPYMTVMENLEVGAFIRNARNKMKDNLEYVLQLFPILKERKSQLAYTLSGGEQQMLAIARGLMEEPKFLMLDEPSLGLAPKLVKLVFETIMKINKERKVTLLLVEQNVRDSLEMADRAYVLEAGKVVLEGKGKDLLRNKHIKKAYLGL